MRISWNWLKQYAPVDLSVQEAADILTSTGLEVEGVELVEPIKGMLQGVVIGEVMEKVPHPDADRLSVCKVNVANGESLSIVCGAPNVAEGQKVLVATVGATLHPNDGSEFKIKRSKIRGEESMGMICAEDELGMGESHDGILVLPVSAKAGTPAAEHFNLTADHALEIGLTPNRSDALGHIGVARDLLAALNFRQDQKHLLVLPSVEAFSADDESLPVKVTVDDEVACPRYAGCSVTNLKVGPSPEWLQQRLLAIGLKPINNVVDVTNFVQHETGTPLHAFDVDKVADQHIIVKQLPQKTKFVTLDEKEHELDVADLMICDSKGGLCIAGVFGGQHSGVSQGTTKVFLESAVFDPTSIRKTAKRHGMHTDASFRFERSVDPEMTIYALKRAALLLKEVAGAKISSPISDHYPSPKKNVEVSLTYDQIDRLAGQPISKEDVVRILKELDMPLKDLGEGKFSTSVPHYRADVTRPADVVEEVMRIYGFDRIDMPSSLRVPVQQRTMNTTEELRKAVCEHLASRGFRETMTPSLASASVTLEEGTNAVHLSNPLSSELDVMRTTMVHGMLNAVAFNLNRQQKDLRFFEQGRIYGLKDGKVVEQERIAMLMTGSYSMENWRSVKRKVDLNDMKQELELLMGSLLPSELLSVKPAKDDTFSNCAEVIVREKVIGRIGQVSGKVAKQADVSQAVFYAELWPAPIAKMRRKRKVQFEEVPRFPFVRRDLSLLIDQNVGFEQLRDLALQTEKKLLREVSLFDVYQGDKLPDGKKSYALSFILQDTAKTLTDKQVDKTMARIREVFETKVGAELRG